MKLESRPIHAGMMPLASETALATAILALSRLDPVTVAAMIEIGGLPPLRHSPAGFEGLARIVVAQQVSVASATAIFSRLKAMVVPFGPAVLACHDDRALRACGLSGGKIKTLRAIAGALLGGTLRLDHLVGQPVEEARAALIAIPGIGPWTAEVFLLVCLGHVDAWPAGDVALQEATRLVLDLDRRPDAGTLRVIGERWRPYRGAAAYLLWACYRAMKHRHGLAPLDTG